jgi:hypothetical protein
MKRNNNILSAALLGGAIFATSVSADNHDGIHFGGYADTSWNSVNRDGDANDTNTFSVPEGALYVGKKFDGSEVYLDLGFTETSGTFTATISQAWVAANYENGLSWKMGQFDNLFGWYAGREDSHQYNFSHTGFLQNYFPRLHMGGMLAYNFSDMLDVQLVVANDRDDNGGAKLDDGNGRLDFGVNVGADVDTFSVDVGFLFENGNDAVADEFGYVGSLAVATTFDPVSVGLYGVFSQPDVEDADSDFGVGLDLAFDVNEQISFGVRGEWAQIGDSNVFGSGIGSTTYNETTMAFEGDGAALLAGEGKQVMQVTVGPQMRMNDNVTAKLDYTWEQLKNDDDDETLHGISFNVLAHF